ncbi:hypothetical protein M9Y10_012780 [Tritrichomonas musculus]|uniref:Chromo domain-containing protein n=1 Tax=Tritrichomonas musculus TaxID=1915356 RepID=A0ABR2IDC4_9EUKA
MSSDIEEEEEEAGYEVEEILKHRETASGLSYFLKWKGFPSSENSWESESNLNCKELLDSYWEKVREDEKKKSQLEKKGNQKDSKQKTRDARIEIIGVRKDDNGKIIFLTKNKINGEKAERSLAYLKYHSLNPLINFFESSFDFTSTTKLKMSDIKIGKT